MSEIKNTHHSFVDSLPPSDVKTRLEELAAERPPLEPRHIERREVADTIDSYVMHPDSGLEMVDLQPDAPYVVSAWPEDLPPTTDVQLTSIETGETANYPRDDEPVMSQRLMTVLRAGDETFAVVKAKAGLYRTTDQRPEREKIIVTRVGPETDMEKGVDIVGIIEPGKDLSVGRNTNPKYDSTLESDHFSLRLLDDGKVEVRDGGTPTGTKLIRMRTEEVYVKSRHESKSGMDEVYTEAEIGDVAVGGLKRFLKGKQSIESFTKMTDVAVNQQYNLFNKDRMTMQSMWYAKMSQAEIALGITE